MNHERLQELIEKFPSRRIAVLGDFFLDKYLDVDLPIDGKHFVAMTLDREPLEKGARVKHIAISATGEKIEEFVVDDVMLYASEKPLPPPASSVPELVSGPGWFDLFDGKSFENW
ncbi:MAG TPA: hypothetical protein EYP14_19350, partial [Planctomycetaceae bacterium]|nr:hypothetical protein [Planctomycetaceae bacterium]